MGPIEGQKPECYTVLAFLAASTRRMELMALATPPHFRYPALLAKMVSTLDVLSGGRAWLGIGAGDYADEAQGLGIPTADRRNVEMLEETVQICLRMWSGEHGDDQPYYGRHLPTRAGAQLATKPRPAPPSDLIAGAAEAETLRLVARYADACNINPGPQIPQKLDVLRRHCADEGRDYTCHREDLPVSFRCRCRGVESAGVDRTFALAGRYGHPDGVRGGPASGSDHAAGSDRAQSSRQSPFPGRLNTQLQALPDR